MAQGAGLRTEPILGKWPLPLHGVIQGIDDTAIPPTGLYSALNVEIINGTLRGRRGLTQQHAQLFGAKPMGALNFWQSLSAAWVILVTTAKIWTYDITGASWADRSGSLTGGADDPARVLQFEFGTPTTNRVYICNGVNALKTWKPGDASASTVVGLGTEKVSNGAFGSATNWILGTGWALDSTNGEMDHTAGNTADLEQNVSSVAAESYQVVFTVRNMTAGTVTPKVGGVAGTAVSSNATSTQTIIATGAGNLIFTPSSDFDGSIDDVSVKKVSADAPTFRDITSLGDRILGIVGSHAVQWGEPLTDSSWPAANQKLFTETPAPLTAIRTLGNIGVAAYKKDSIWLGELTGLAGASAYRWSHLMWIDGPAGPNALVDCNGEHIYMTRTGRVGRFNGASHNWIAEGVWSVVRAEIDQTKPNRIHGVYLPQEHQVWFTYKRTGQTNTDGLLIVQLAHKETKRPYAAFPGRWNKSVTASCTMVEESFNTSMVFTDNSGAEKSYRIEGVNDDSVAITSHIQPGLTAAPTLESVRVLSIEPFLERAGGYGTLTVKAVTSNILSDIAGTLSGAATIDLTTTPIKEVVGVDARGRFLGIRLDWTSTATVRYRGITLRAPSE